MPVVTGEHYHVFWEDDDFQGFNLEVKDLRPDQHVWLTFHYTEQTGYMGVVKNGRHVLGSKDSMPIPGSNVTGDFHRNFESRTLTILLTGDGQPTGADVWDSIQRIGYVDAHAATCPCMLLPFLLC